MHLSFMRVENLINFAIDEIQPILPGTIVDETGEQLENNPNQIHLRTIFEVLLENQKRSGGIDIRVDQVGPEEQIMRICGANHDASPKLVINVNGDNSWKSKLKEAVNSLKADPYLCVPDED